MPDPGNLDETVSGVRDGDLVDLLARVESASGPDSGIDGRIALYLDGWAFHFNSEYDDRWEGMGGHWLPPEAWLHDRSPLECRCKTDAAFDVPPDYTASLDASLGLVERVLPGWDVEISRLDGTWSAGLGDPLLAYDGDANASPALALLPAMLKALIAQAADTSARNVPAREGEKQERSSSRTNSSDAPRFAAATDAQRKSEKG